MAQGDSSPGAASAEPANRPVALDPSWQAALGGEFEAAYMSKLREFLQSQKKARKIIYPPGKEMFAALNSTAFDKTKVVIIGQDPYHGPDQAHGLSFSVRPGVALPPSLVNIFQEINDDVASADRRLDSKSGCLDGWAEQGVLLLNSVLSVEHSRAGSHQGKGWERFTDACVVALNDKRDNLVFLLWGAYAQKKGSIVDESRHCVLRAPHPSPLAAYRGFFGCRHFSKANSYLQQHSIEPIDWLAPNASGASDQYV